jgi:hypothetical protein
MKVICKGLEIDNVYIPSFKLQKGQVLCLHWSLPMNTKTEEKFIKYLTGEIKNSQIITSCLLLKGNPPNIPNKFFHFFKAKRVKDIIKDLMGNEVIKSFCLICEHLQINIEDDFETLSLTQKYLLGIEIVCNRKPDILLFDTAGLDPLGEMKVFNLIEQKLNDMGAIYFSYPCIPSRTCYPYTCEHLIVTS